MEKLHSAHIPLSRELTLALIERIEKGIWKAGERIPGEQSIAREFGISRGIVRESLKSLGILDVLESRHGSGTYVSSRAEAGIANWRLYHALGQDADLTCLLDTRLLLEPALAAAAAERAGEAELAAIAAAVRIYGETEAPPRSEEALREAVERSRAFHRAVARASGNPVLFELMETISACLYKEEDYIEGYRRLSDGEIKKQFNEHGPIYEAIRNRDPAGARRSMEQHLKRRKMLIEST